MLVLGVAFFLYGRGGNKSALLRLAKVERGPLVSTISSTGTLSAVVTVQVGSQVSGQIKALLADYNSEVKEGQVIARIDPETFETRVRQAEAELAVSRSNVAIQRASVQRAKTELENARAAHAAGTAQVVKAKAALADTQRTFERREALIRKNAISVSQMDEATAARDQASAQLNAAEAQERAEASLIESRAAALQMAEAQVNHALEQVRQRQASLDQTRVDLEHTIIRSPVDGVVIERSVDVGQTVAASLQAPKLFTIAQDLRKMQVETNVDEADIGRVRVGQNATFTVDAFPGREFTGQVQQIRKAPQTIQNVVTYTVIVSAENPELALLPGMTANVRIMVDERPSVLKVPNPALRFRPDGDAGAGAAGASSAPAPPGGQGQAGKSSPEDLVKRMAGALNLSQDQQTQLKEIFSAARERVVALRQQGGSPEDVRAETQKVREQSRSSALALLTREQAERYKALLSAREGGAAGRGRVYVLGPDNKPRPVDVVTGITDGAFTEIIRGGLAAGDLVILGKGQAPARRSPSGFGRFGL